MNVWANKCVLCGAASTRRLSGTVPKEIADVQRAPLCEKCCPYISGEKYASYKYPGKTLTYEELCFEIAEILVERGALKLQSTIEFWLPRAYIPPIERPFNKAEYVKISLPKTCLTCGVKLPELLIKGSSSAASAFDGNTCPDYNGY